MLLQLNVDADALARRARPGPAPLPTRAACGLNTSTLFDGKLGAITEAMLPRRGAPGPECIALLGWCR